MAAILVFSLRQTFADSSVTFEILATFDYPGADSTFAAGLNERGDAAGVYTYSSANTLGFIRFLNHLSASIIDPNDRRGNSSTQVTDINDAGTICGYYFNADFHWHGFLASGGTFTDVSTGGLGQLLDGREHRRQQLWLLGKSYWCLCHH
jgi:hypothetical protein